MADVATSGPKAGLDSTSAPWIPSEVDETVAERWNLPARYVAAIAHHHEPAAAGDESRFCALIGVANQAAHAAASGRLETAREAERDAHLALLQLGAADWDECLTHIAESGPEIDAFVGAIR
jgi:HD-like signal output (HDOD) protein